jgi:hypothetical protein
MTQVRSPVNKNRAASASFLQLFFDLFSNTWRQRVVDCLCIKRELRNVFLTAKQLERHKAAARGNLTACDWI